MLLKQSTDRTYQRLQQTGKRSTRAGNAAAVASTAGPTRSSKRRGRAKSSPTRGRKARRAVASGDDGRERQTSADTSGRDVSVSGSISDRSRSGGDDDGNRSRAGSAGCGSLEGVPKTRRWKKSSQRRCACQTRVNMETVGMRGWWPCRSLLCVIDTTAS